MKAQEYIKEYWPGFLGLFITGLLGGGYRLTKLYLLLAVVAAVGTVLIFMNNVDRSWSYGLLFSSVLAGFVLRAYISQNEYIEPPRNKYSDVGLMTGIPSSMQEYKRRKEKYDNEGFYEDN